jgi:predicted amidohydrolase
MREPSKLRVMLAALCCQKGDWAANLGAHENVLRRAREQSCDIAVFPEMSLSGSVDPRTHPEHLLRMDSEPVRAVTALTRQYEVAAIFGIAEQDADGPAHITQAYALDGRLIGAYRKRHLGEGEEGFAPGSAPALFKLGEHSVGKYSVARYSVGKYSVSKHSVSKHSVDEHNAGEHSAGEHSAGEHSAGEHSFGIAICAEGGVDYPFDEPAAAGAKVIFFCAAPGLYGRRTDEESWRAGYQWWESAGLNDARRHARRTGAWVALATQAGSAIDEDFPGIAALVDPTGEVVARLPDWREGTLVVDLPLA